MSHQYPSRFHIPLRPGTSYVQPHNASRELIGTEAPALQVMTDFHKVIPQAIEPHIQIDLALERMKLVGVRLLLVTDSNDDIIGLLSATDIMGEKPIRLVQEQRIAREDIAVSHVMSQLEDVQVLDLRSVHGAQVGHIIETLHELKLQHILVVEVDDQSGEQTVRGLFSSSQISRQMLRDISQDIHAASSLSEILHTA